MRKWSLFAVKLAVSIGLIWWVLRDTDLQAIWDKVAAVGWGPPVLTIFLILGVQAPLAGVRWGLVLKAMRARLPYWYLVQVFVIGTFFNQVLPSSVGGDAVRIYKTYRRGLLLSQAFNGVMLERLAITLSLVAIVVAVQPLFLSRIDGSTLIWIFPLLALLGLAGTIALMSLDRLPVGLRRWRVVRGLAVLAADSRRVFLSAKWGGGILAASVLGNVNVVLMFYVLAQGLDLDVTMLDCLVLVPPVMLVMTLPISIAGWGVREGAVVTGFGMIGVPAEGALVLSLLFGILALVSALPGGLLWVMHHDRMADVEKLQQTAAADGGR